MVLVERCHRSTSQHIAARAAGNSGSQNSLRLPDMLLDCSLCAYINAASHTSPCSTVVTVDSARSILRMDSMLRITCVYWLLVLLLMR